MGLQHTTQMIMDEIDHVSSRVKGEKTNTILQNQGTNSRIQHNTFHNPNEQCHDCYERISLVGSDFTQVE